MNIVIIGGHDRMVRQYKDICKQHSAKAKVFTQMPSNLKDKMGMPDLLVLFTNTVSHKMVQCAMQVAERSDASVIRSHSSSACALKNILADHCGPKSCPKCANCDALESCSKNAEKKRKRN